MKNKDNRALLFSHKNDIDGIGCVVLALAAFPSVEYILSSNVYELEHEFRDNFQNNNLYKYDKIYITDLSLYNPSVELVSKDPVLSQKVLVFDHHQTAIKDGLNHYSFVTILEEDNNIKRCATDLFYEHLLSCGLLNKTSILDELVELTRLEDTWEWKKASDNGIKAHDMAILFNKIGIEKYIESMLNKIKNSSLEFTEEEQLIIANAKKEYQKILEQIMTKAEYFQDDQGNAFAAVFASYEYRNELSEYVRANNDKNIDYLIIVALDKGDYGQKPYRAIKDNVDVGCMAEAHGGGGHKASASVNISKIQNEQSKLIKNNKERLKYLIESVYDN